jgi:hypothetical protein
LKSVEGCNPSTHDVYKNKAPLKAKRRTKLHKKREVRKQRNIKSPCPIKEGFDQNVLVLVLHYLQNILHSALSIWSTLSTMGLFSTQLELNKYPLDLSNTLTDPSPFLA